MRKQPGTFNTRSKSSDPSEPSGPHGSRTLGQGRRHKVAGLRGSESAPAKTSSKVADDALTRSPTP